MPGQTRDTKMTRPNPQPARASNPGMSLPRTFLCLAFAAAAIVWLAGAGSGRASAQASSGPQTPVKPPEIIRIPATPAPPDAPPIPPAEIIRRFAAQEDAAAQAALNFSYRKIVRLTEYGPDGQPSGQSQVTSTPTTDADGKHYQKISGGDQDSTLKVLSLERDALQGLATIPTFPLVTAQLPKYQITYEGTQPVDELTTYVFRVKPVQVERERAYFDGLVWVDNHDLAIVKSYGKWVSETGPMSPPTLPFTMYETYRQPVANKYWMPAYASSEGSVPNKGGKMTVRLVIRWDNYTPSNAPLPPAAPTVPAAAQTPPSPQR